MARGDERITKEGEPMYVKTTYGSVWVSETAPYFRSWAGRTAYTYLMAQAKAAQRQDAAS
jgi:hypothetical protein